jgi:hypothetical protein
VSRTPASVLIPALAALGTAGAAPAAPAVGDFGYIELNYLDVDVDLDERVGSGDSSIGVSTDDGTGIGFGAAWRFRDVWHLYFDYGATDQTLTTAGTIDGEPFRLQGDFDVTRIRVGLGYARLVRDDLRLYVRAGLDAIDFDEVSSGPDDASDTDDAGPGGELGARWAFAGPVELQGHVRYTTVGEVDVTGVDEFDDDLLFGLALRWRLTRHFSVQAGAETGEILTWYVGGRVVP